MTPIDIIAEALRATDDVRDENGLADRARAVVAANALTHDGIVAHAADQLRHHPDAGHHSARELREFAAIVLRSVSGDV